MMFNYDAFKAGMQIPNKKTMEQELAQKMQLMREQADLENNQLSAEEKLYRLSQQDPAGFQKYMEIKNALSPYQEAMLGIQRGQLGLQGARLNQQNITPQQQNFYFLKRQFPNKPEEEILKILYKEPKTTNRFSFED